MVQANIGAPVNWVMQYLHSKKVHMWWLNLPSLWWWHHKVWIKAMPLVVHTWAQQKQWPCIPTWTHHTPFNRHSWYLCLWSSIILGHVLDLVVMWWITSFWTPKVMGMWVSMWPITALEPVKLVVVIQAIRKPCSLPYFTYCALPWEILSLFTANHSIVTIYIYPSPSSPTRKAGGGWSRRYENKPH